MNKLLNKNIRWVLFVAARGFIKDNSKNSSKSKRVYAPTGSILSILEIGAGVLALTVIIAVMNGFQLGFIENILEISSYYIRIDNFPREYISKIDSLEAMYNITAIDPFLETQGITSGVIEGGQCAAVLRGLDQSAFEGDAGLRKHLVPVSGILDLSKEKTILLGAELASRLAVDIGDHIDFLSVTNIFSSNAPASGGTTGESDDAADSFVVGGIFRSGYYEYDAGWGFINFNEAISIENDKPVCTIGIKIKNRFDDTASVNIIQKFLDENLGKEIINQYDVSVSSWRDYNKSFFNALRTEKLLMFVLVGLIFVVVALNIYQSQRRTVLEHSEDIGLMRAVGANDFSVRWIFALKGLIIGLAGATGGMILAIIISINIQGFFALIEAVVRTALTIVYIISNGIFFGASRGMDFAVFSKRIFYIQEYTARLITHEVILIYFFAVLSAFLAAWFASARISKIKPSEVLRYE